MNHPDWIKHKKHIFVLSSAGKPIYSRFVLVKLSTNSPLYEPRNCSTEYNKNYIISDWVEELNVHLA